VQTIDIEPVSHHVLRVLLAYPCNLGLDRLEKTESKDASIAAVNWDMVEKLADERQHADDSLCRIALDDLKARGLAIESRIKAQLDKEEIKIVLDSAKLEEVFIIIEDLDDQLDKHRDLEAKLWSSKHTDEFCRTEDISENVPTAEYFEKIPTRCTWYSKIQASEAAIGRLISRGTRGRKLYDT